MRNEETRDMKKRKFISVALIFLISAVIGGIAGASIVAYFLFSFFNNGSMMQDLVGIKQDVTALQKIRAGDTDGATESLESALDRKLIRFSLDLKGSKQMRHSINNALSSAKTYRTKYPRTTDCPGIDEAVAQALSRTNQ